MWKSILALLPVLSLSFGCAEELGPEPMTTANVRGTIRFRGHPVGPGWVEFAPTDGTVGLVSSARLNADGTFRARRVPVGTVGLRLAGVRMPNAGSPALSRALFLMTQGNLIHRRIEASRSNILDVDLAVEAAELVQ
jgi:hypothetical protein